MLSQVSPKTELLGTIAAGFYRQVVQPTASKHQRKLKVLTPSLENHPVLLFYLNPSDDS